VIAKNNSYENCRVQREATVDDFELDLEVDFQNHFKINSIFQWKPVFFIPDLERAQSFA